MHSKTIFILVTSRTPSLTENVIQLPQLSMSDSADLVQRILPEEQQDARMKLIRTLSGHPLALATALAAITTYPSISIADYVKAHEKRKTEDLDRKVKVDQYEQTLSVSLEFSLKAIEQKSADATRMVRLLTFVKSTQIPFSYIKEWIKFTRSKQTADQILKTICDQSLLEVSYKFDPDSKEKKKKNVRLAMHDLVHKVIHQDIPDGQKVVLLPEAIAMVAGAFQGRNDLMNQKILREPEYLVHALQVLEEAKRLKFTSIPLLSLQIRVLDCVACGKRDFEKAKELISDIQVTQKHLADMARTLPPETILPSLEPQDVALLETVLGFFERAAYSNYEKAIRHQEKALQILEPFKGEEEQKLRVLTNLLQDRTWHVEMEQAQSLVEEGKKLLHMSRSDLTSAFFVSTWILFLVNQGKFEEALECIQKYGGVFSNVKDYPTLEMFALRDKAKALYKLGKHEKCNQVLDRAEKMVQKFFGHRPEPLKEYLVILRVLNNKEKSPSLPEDALQLQKILQSYEKLGKDQKHAYAYFALGQIYEQMKELEKAGEAYSQSAQIYEALLKNREIDDVSELYAAISLLGLRLKDTGTSEGFLQNHIQLFGRDHPRTEAIFDYREIYYKEHPEERVG